MDQRRTLVIPGGSGFLGRAASRWFLDAGWRVIVLSRVDGPKVADVERVAWDGRTFGPWASALDGADAVLNLAGRSVNCRYTATNRDAITRSRVESTRVIGEAIRAAARPPRVWLNSSTATIYRHAEDRPQGDDDGEIGEGFSVGVARVWEAAFFESPAPATRKLALRSAMVMGRGAGGPFAVFHHLARFGLGGAMGSGTQRVSWVHVDDFCRAVAFLIDREDASGTINLTAPGPVTNRDFMRDLRAAAGARIGLPAHRWMIEVGAIFIRTESELPLKSRWVVPTRLVAMGYTFAHPEWSAAARDLVSRARSS